MGKKILILLSVIGVTAGLYYGLEMLKPSSTVDIENPPGSTNPIVEQIKQDINAYSEWEKVNYQSLQSKIELKANMENINLQEKTTLNTLLENKNAELLKTAFDESIIACDISTVVNNEIERVSSIAKYEEFFKDEKKTLKNYNYINKTLKSSINTLCSNKYHEGSYDGKFKLIAKYFTNDVRKCNEMNALKAELKKKLETFKSVGISFDILNPETHPNEWKDPDPTNATIEWYNTNAYNRSHEFEAFVGYKYYENKLKSLNIILYNGEILFQ